MKLPRINSEIERRLLVNYRADPQVVARLLPAPFRPQLAGDAAVVGICLFPAGSVTLDHALVMRRIPVQWHALDRIAATAGASAV